MARFAGPGITSLVALGFELSGFENFYIALALWVIAGLWGLGALLTWRPIRQRLRFLAGHAQRPERSSGIETLRSKVEKSTRARLVEPRKDAPTTVTFRPTTGRRSVQSPPDESPRAFDPELQTLLSHGRGIKDDYLLGGGLRSVNRAQRDEGYLWSRDTASVLKARDPALAERFLAAQNHRERLRVLADILGVDEP